MSNQSSNIYTNHFRYDMISNNIFNFLKYSVMES